MNIFQSVLFFLSLGLLIIGTHQTITVGFYESYWLFMLSLVLLFIYGMMKKGNNTKNKKANSPQQKTKPKRKKSTRHKK